MLRLAACVWLGVFLLPSFAQAASQTFEVMVTTERGEQEAEACARASDELRRKSVDSLVKASADLRDYHKLLDAYTWQGKSRSDLDQDISAKISDVEIMELSRFWSGKSCLLRGYVDLDPAPVLSEMLSGTSAAPPASEDGDGESWFAMPGAAIDKIRNQRLLADAILELSTLKMMVSERWAMTNTWPRSLSDMNLDAKDFETSQRLDNVVMGDGGVIRARLKSPLGGETLIFTPEMGAMGTIRWSCTTTVQVLFGDPCSD